MTRSNRVESILKITLLFIISFVLTMGTIFIPKTVNNQDEMKNVQLGYPTHFITQDYSSWDPPSFPRQYSFGSPYENPYVFHLPRFIISFLMILAVCKIVVMIFEKVKARYSSHQM